jgi:hypothetical protein
MKSEVARNSHKSVKTTLIFLASEKIVLAKKLLPTRQPTWMIAGSPATPEPPVSGISAGFTENGGRRPSNKISEVVE